MRKSPAAKWFAIPRTHVRATNLHAAFSKAVVNVFSLTTLVIAQTSDEVVQGFLEPTPY